MRPRLSASVVLLAVWAFATSAVGVAQIAAPPRRPSVLLMLADDLNVDLGSYGAGYAKTPNIDALASRGMRFESAYAQYPLCNPSRVSLMSGLRPGRTGVLDLMTPTRTTLRQAELLPELFRRHGYRTCRQDPASGERRGRGSRHVRRSCFVGSPDSRRPRCKSPAERAGSPRGSGLSDDRAECR